MMEASYDPLGQAVAYLRNILINVFTRKDKIKFWCLGFFLSRPALPLILQDVLLICVLNRYLSMCNHYVWFLRHALVL